MKNGLLPALLRPLANTGDGVFAVDGSLRIILWNEAAERLLGYRAQEVLGMRCYEVLAGRDQTGKVSCGPHCLLFSEARKGKPVKSHHLLTRTKTRRGIWINVSVIGVPSNKEDSSAVVHIFRDVTRQMHAERLVETIHSTLTGRSWPGEGVGSPTENSNPLQVLTARQMEVLKLIAQGAGSQAIAEKLSIRPVTVRNHTQKILAKLGVHSKLEALAFALRHLRR